MADDQRLDPNVNIQSTINVGTAKDQTTVSGAKVSVGSARDVHVHGDTTPSPPLRSVALVGVLAFLGAVLINIATSQLPESWKSYLWLAWPLAILVTASNIWVAYRQNRSAASSVTIGSTLDERNRARMLDKVENFWIKGVLDQSLYQTARLELGLEQAPEKIDHPWQTVLQQAAASRIVPAGTPVIKLFDDLDGKLLILGAPGAGKTTLLLELARDLIARARSDTQHPIPLLFNLSTWASKRQPLREWLIEELNQRYDVPSKLAQQWVEADAILPLLDGLDEVAAAQRDPCVEAINSYRHERGLVSLAVCSRAEEYTALTDKLLLQGAVVIQPLTQQTVDVYLRQVGRPLAAVRVALRDDPKLWELLGTPLMLSIVALAYKDKPIAKLRSSGTFQERRRQLFDDYIAAMFARRGREERYPPQQITHWLSWLAEQMVAHKLTIYYIEQMQPEWLLPKQQRVYQRRVRILLGLVIGLAGGLVGGLVLGLVGGLLGGALLGMAAALVLGLVVGLAGGLVGGLLLGLVGGQINEMLGEVLKRFLGEPFYELMGGLLGQRLNQIVVVEALRWSWSSGWSALRRFLILGLVVGVGFSGFYVLLSLFLDGLLGVQDYYTKSWLLSRLMIGLWSGLGSALGGVLLVGLLSGLSMDEIETTKIAPNEGIRRSVSSALGVAVGGGLLIVLPSALGDELARMSVYGLVGGAVTVLADLLFNIVMFGLIVGVVFGLHYGGRAVLQHYILRWQLYRNGSLPLRDLIPFLDYCTERIFLRKVGGGYIFVHRLLMEHFASLYREGQLEEPDKARRRG